MSHIDPSLSRELCVCMMLQIVATTWCSPSEQVWSEQFNLFTVVNDSTALSIFLVDVGRYHATNP